MFRMVRPDEGDTFGALDIQLNIGQTHTSRCGSSLRLWMNPAA